MVRRFSSFKPILSRLPYGPADFALLLGTFLLLYSIARVGAGLFVAFKPPILAPHISLDPANLPYYAARSSIRMFIALFISVLFTLGYGYACAKNRMAEKVLVPLLDILQSVPVLGFLAVTVTFFISLFPGSLLGLECASIFAVFTGQAWNMTFSFYHSLITIPRDLDEAATIFHLSKWRRFTSVEVPSAMIGLVWNAMMSFGGGWFFVTISEAISINNSQYNLPGIGSYIYWAIKLKDMRALFWAVITMVIVILAVDQLFWRPIVAWSEKFKLEKSASAEPARSWLLNLIRSSRIPRQISRSYRRMTRRIPRISVQVPELKVAERFRTRRRRVNDDAIYNALLGGLIVIGLYFGFRFVTTEVRGRELLICLGLGCLTLLRVFVLLILATIVWTPIGVAIGFNPRLAQIAQPIVLNLASFPANVLFPFATVLFLYAHISINIGSILLMALGAQWYILFNSIAGGMSVPTDLREMAANMGLRGWHLWRKLIIPAIFPAWVTGAITASGGAWNASIVAEVVVWGKRTLMADGLGAYITRYTNPNDWPRIVLGITVMSFFVVVINRTVWRRLYALAESRYHLG